MCRTPERSYRLEAVELRHQPVLGRRLAENRRAELADQPEPLGRVERPLVEDGRRAPAPRAEQDVPDRLRPARAGGAPDDVVRARVEPALGLRALGPRVPVRVHDALRILRRPGGVEDERRILGAGVGGLERSARRARPRRCRRPRATRSSPRSPPREPGSATSSSRARVANAEVEILGAQHLRAGDRDRADLQPGEHHREPVRRLADQHEHAVAGGDAALAEQAGPARGRRRPPRRRSGRGRRRSGRRSGARASPDPAPRRRPA